MMFRFHHVGVGFDSSTIRQQDVNCFPFVQVPLESIKPVEAFRRNIPVDDPRCFPAGERDHPGIFFSHDPVIGHTPEAPRVAGRKIPRHFFHDIGTHERPVCKYMRHLFSPFRFSATGAITPSRSFSFAHSFGSCNFYFKCALLHVSVTRFFTVSLQKTVWSTQALYTARLEIPIRCGARDAPSEITATVRRSTMDTQGRNMNRIDWLDLPLSGGFFLCGCTHFTDDRTFIDHTAPAADKVLPEPAAPCPYRQPRLRTFRRPSWRPAPLGGLADIIDVALRNSPSTRAAWHTARGAAADLLSQREGTYFPELSGFDLGEADRCADLGRQEHPDQHQPDALLSLTYLLFDFGGRKAFLEEKEQALPGQLPAHRRDTGPGFPRASDLFQICRRQSPRSGPGHVRVRGNHQPAGG